MSETVLPVTRTFIWGMYGDDPIKKFERFSKLALVGEKHVTELLMALVDSYIKDTDFSGTLVEERQLLDELNKHDVTVSRVTLKNYRRQDKLVKGEHWYTDGRNICYHLERCVDFFLKKKNKVLPQAA